MMPIVRQCGKITLIVIFFILIGVGMVLLITEINQIDEVLDRTLTLIFFWLALGAYIAGLVWVIIRKRLLKVKIIISFGIFLLFIGILWLAAGTEIKLFENIVTKTYLSAVKMGCYLQGDDFQMWRRGPDCYEVYSDGGKQCSNDIECKGHCLPSEQCIKKCLPLLDAIEPGKIYSCKVDCKGVCQLGENYSTSMFSHGLDFWLESEQDVLYYRKKNTEEFQGVIVD